MREEKEVQSGVVKLGSAEVRWKYTSKLIFIESDNGSRLTLYIDEAFAIVEAITKALNALQDMNPEYESSTFVLLPCPFCGGNATIYRPFCSDELVVVGCYHRECPANPKVNGLGERAARNLWNKRAKQ